MKKLFSVILTVFMVFSSVGCSAQQESKAEDKSADFGVKLNIDGEDKNLVAYNIEDNNYFKLRDVANVLKGTKAHFDVSWNDDKKAIELISNADYSTNEEISNETLENPTATQRDVAIYMDNARILMRAYEIAGNNYFKLRDLASAIDFNVSWNGEKEMIEIDTSKGYEYPTESNGNFGLNTKYLSFMGMTKAYIDEKCGNKGSFDGELGMSDYGNGLMAGYGVLGNYDTPKDTDRASTLYISFDNLFFNCPDTLTVDLIKSVFSETKNGYNEMDEERLLLANYCGVAIEFYIDLSMNKTSYACVRTNSSFEDIEDAETQTSVSFIGSETQYSTYQQLCADMTSKLHDINVFDLWWHDLYYALADLDSDGQNELAVRLGFGVGIYKEMNGKVYQLYYNLIDASNYPSYKGPEYKIISIDNKYYITDNFEYYYEYKNGNLNYIGSMAGMRYNTDYSDIEFTSVDELF